MSESEEKKRDRESRVALRERRIARVAAKVGHLPTSVGEGFFQELQRSFPVPPSIAAPVSQMCTTSQFEEPDYRRLAMLLLMKPRLHRKQWEFIYILRCIESMGMIAPGRRGLVFGVGQEKLPSLFASRDCKIVATDLPSEESQGHWAGGNQHADSLEKVFHEKIVSRETFFANASFRPVNMNRIPDDLTGFDFCWSSCALEHLGSLKHGLDFIRNSLKCLKPGGIAVHTTEFNLGSEFETLETGPCVVYRKSDLLAFADDMKAQGHKIELNLNPGNEPADYMIDRDRNADIHLRLYVANKILGTSIGLFIQTRGPA